MSDNTSWELESFIDAMVVELDKTRETLAIKAINKPLSYSVKDMSMDLNIFPRFDGDNVKFVTAQPGEEGASTISLQLASITDRQVRETSKNPSSNRNDISLDNTNLDKDVKKQLRKIGVTSVSDLDEIQKNHVDLKKVGPKGVDYNNLANMIKQSRRGENPPKVRSASLSEEKDRVYSLDVIGEGLSVDTSFEPVAVVNNTPVKITHKSHNNITLSCPKSTIAGKANEVVIVLDPFSVLRFTLTGSQ